MSPWSWLRAAALVAALAAAGPALAQYPPPPPGYPPGYGPPPSQPVKPPPPPEGRLRLSAFTGWQLNGDVVAYAGKLVVDDAMSYGAALDFLASPMSTGQLLWIYCDTKARFNSYDLLYPSSKDFGVQEHYMQIGGTRFVARGKVEPFMGGTLGAVLIIPGSIQTVGGTTYGASDTWRFAMTLGGGVKVNFSPKLALRLETRLLLPMYFQGGSVYVGTGGSGMAVSAGVPSWQGNFTAGLTFTP
jgi:hypothetical protein